MENIKEELEAFAARCRRGPLQEWEGGSLECADLRGADLMGANLTGADFLGANLENANLMCAELYGAKMYGANLKNAYLIGAVLEDADLESADLRGADLTGANLRSVILECANLEGAIGFRFEDAPDPQTLRYEVADQIEGFPDLHDQNKWGAGDPNECGTPCCVAGWACRLGGGARGKNVEVAALRLLHVDGKDMPSFHHDAEREDIINALRA